MGSMLRASCDDCGLEQELLVGGGMMDFTTTAAVPAGCTTCHRLVTVNTKLAAPHPCMTDGCAGSPAIIGEITGSVDHGIDRSVFDWLVDDDTGTRYVLGGGPHPCPVCGHSRLTFEMTGFWD